jgi:hypothetical protein
MKSRDLSGTVLIYNREFLREGKWLTHLLPNGLIAGRRLRKGKHLFERIHGKDPYVQVLALERHGLATVPRLACPAVATVGRANRGTCLASA